MDQIKVALAWLKVHHFWVLAVLVVGLASGAWYSASSSIAKEFKSNKQKINSEFTAQGGLLNKPFKPNDAINSRQEEEIAQLAVGVRNIWSELYGRQKEAVLEWPQQLGKKFAKYVENKNFGDTINTKWRDRYLNYIQKRFTDLIAIVDAEETQEGGSRRGSRGLGGGAMMMEGGGGIGGARGARGGSEEPIETHLVEWVDQGDLRERLNLDKRPSSLKIWVLQEDLWVYETLLKEIADTNRLSGATRRNRAAIRTILQLQVGRNAAGGNASSGRLFIPQDLEAIAGDGMGRGGMGRGDMGMGDMGMGMGMDGGRSEMGGMRGMGMGGRGMGGETDGDEATVLLAGRYVDEEGAPITSVPEDRQFGVEYKRLPVRLVLEMDRRYLPALIVELANAPLQVEVEQVRVNPSDAGAAGGRRRRGGTGNDSVEAFDREPTVGTVVLQGVVYIFNPPDEQVLAVEAEDAI